MRLPRALAVGVGLAILVGCQARTGHVTVSLHSPPLARYETATVQVQIVNGARWPIVLDRLSVTGAREAQSWSSWVAGGLTYDKTTDRFHDDLAKQTASPIRSQAAILPPGARRMCGVPVTIDQSGPVALRAELRYHAVDSEDEARRIYLSRPEDRPGPQAYTPATMQELKALNPPARLTGEFTLKQAFATRGLPPTETVVGTREVQVAAARFPLDEAVAAVGNARVLAHAYEPHRNRWLLETKDSLWLVEKGRKKVHRGLGIDEYQALARRQGKLSFELYPSLTERQQAGVRKLAAPYGAKGSKPWLYFDLPSEDLLAFAEGVSGLGLRVDVLHYSPRRSSWTVEPVAQRPS